MSERKLVELSEEDATRIGILVSLQSVQDEIGPSDSELLRSLADSYKAGITVEEAEALEGTTPGPSSSDTNWRNGWAKLRTFTERNPDA